MNYKTVVDDEAHKIVILPATDKVNGVVIVRWKNEDDMQVDDGFVFLNEDDLKALRNVLNDMDINEFVNQGENN